MSVLEAGRDKPFEIRAGTKAPFEQEISDPPRPDVPEVAAVLMVSKHPFAKKDETVGCVPGLVGANRNFPVYRGVGSGRSHFMTVAAINAEEHGYLYRLRGRHLRYFERSPEPNTIFVHFVHVAPGVPSAQKTTMTLTFEKHKPDDCGRMKPLPTK